MIEEDRRSQVLETFYIVEFGVGTEEEEVHSLFLNGRPQWKYRHLAAGATIEKWFEFERIGNPFVKTICGAILGICSGGSGTKMEVREQIEKMVDGARKLLNFRHIIL